MNKSNNPLIPITTIVILFVLLLALGCQKSGGASSDREKVVQKTESKTASVFDFEKNIGWLHGTCLASKNGALTPGMKVTLIKLDEPQATIETEILGAAVPDTGCFALLEDRITVNKKSNRSFYSVKIPESEANLMAIGVVGQNNQISIENNKATIDLDADGIKEIFSSCQTSEGMKFYVWSGAINQGSPRWSDYYYLGYDLQTTCSDN